MKTPVIGFSAFSGVGKTTVMESVIRLLTARGVRVGVVKHDRHGFDIDHPGKDSYRHTQAGAAAVVITSPEKTAVVEQRGESLEACLQSIKDVDIILVEGFKHADIPRIGLCRKAVGKGFLTVTPGVRFEDGDKGDQSRVTTPAKAKELGSDYIVVGRPITQAADPLEAYRRCVRDFVDVKPEKKNKEFCFPEEI